MKQKIKQAESVNQYPNQSKILAMGDKSFPFTEGEMKDVLAGDTGFKRMLDGMPENQAAGIRDIFTNHMMMNLILKLVPEDLRGQVAQLLDDISTIPDQAARRYYEGRFFEAREKLRKSIEIFNFHTDTNWGGLKQVVEFSKMRARAQTWICWKSIADKRIGCSRQLIQSDGNGEASFLIGIPLEYEIDVSRGSASISRIILEMHERAV